jgi:Transmembrane secretion effector
MKRPRVLRPLRERDFALLFTGITVSLLGDGIYLVAIAWQVYDISNVPTALSLVGVAWTLPMVLFLLIGGVLADRFERRRLLIASDIVRGLAIAGIGVISLTGAIELWHVVVLVAVYGIGQALFAPAHEATIPEIVPRPLLLQANSLYELAEPIAYRFAGPALGGLLVAGLGPGPAFLADAATFGFSALCVSLMSSRGGRLAETPGIEQIRGEIGESLTFVRSQAWLWATLLAAATTLLLFMGPFEVLLPYVVRNEFGGGAAALGLVFAAAGLGAIGSALWIAQRGRLLQRHVLWMYLGWTVAVGSLAGYAIATATWQAMLIGILEGAFLTIGNVTWFTLLQLHVPNEMLGRVSSLDWLVSFGLTPVSFALAGPAAEAFGVETTMIAAGVGGALLTLAFLLVPGLRDPERWAEEERRKAELAAAVGGDPA